MLNEIVLKNTHGPKFTNIKIYFLGGLFSVRAPGLFCLFRFFAILQFKCKLKVFKSLLVSVCAYLITPFVVVIKNFRLSYVL